MDTFDSFIRLFQAGVISLPDEAQKFGITSGTFEEAMKEVARQHKDRWVDWWYESLKERVAARESLFKSLVEDLSDLEEKVSELMV